MVAHVIKVVKDAVRKANPNSLYRACRSEDSYSDWRRAGGSIPPPHSVKQHIVKEYARKYKLPVFIETGTYLGDMVEAVKDIFDEIYSIELSNKLHINAKHRFSNEPHIRLLLGDSGKILGDLMAEIHKPCLLWLDGHYSEGITEKGDLETPILEELNHIFGNALADKHIILIDDARCFNGQGDYPRIQSLEDTVSSKGYKRFEVIDDIIRIRK